MDYSIMAGERMLRQAREDKMERLSDEAVRLHEAGDEEGAQRKLTILRAVHSGRRCLRCHGTGDVDGILGPRPCVRCDGEGYSA